MADTLLQPEFCAHDRGITMTQSKVFCEDCHTEMVWVPAAYLQGLQVAPTERERELRRQLIVKNQALHRIRQYLREVGVE